MSDKRFDRLRITIDAERSILKDIKQAYDGMEKAGDDEKTFVGDQITALEQKLTETHEKLKASLTEILFSKPLEIEKKPLATEKEPQIPKKKKEEEEERNILKSEGGNIYSLKQVLPNELENQTIKKLRKKAETKKNKKVEETSDYSKFASTVFAKYSRKLLGQESFKSMEEKLVKANLNFTPVGYVSTIILTTIISGFIAGFLFFFFLFFNFEATLPIITRATDPLNIRFLKTFWMLFAIPLATFVFMYLYPGMEKKSAEDAINVELPFATIHMAAISGSMINPINIFKIISSTNEYPALEKEFTKMINEINLYGYDLVSALHNTSKNSPSKRLSELLNGLATTIHSGGNLVKFFDKRAQTLLFNYKIEQQRAAKAAETMMDLYISICIATPMILMLLMMIMKISGLGISMSIQTIGLLITLGVLVMNAVFMAIMHMKRKA
ncbi:MAG: type II secretion system F family protein [Nanoarchaeota archaeon]|jgi:Flp pilus assembly protein TadB|nr:type II secretion system F family protein [Nanoarchaeota archaeon]